MLYVAPKWQTVYLQNANLRNKIIPLKKKKNADQRSHDISQQNSSLLFSGLYMTSGTYLAYVGQCLNIVKVKKSTVIQFLLML